MRVVPTGAACSGIALGLFYTCDPSRRVIRSVPDPGSRGGSVAGKGLDVPGAAERQHVERQGGAAPGVFVARGPAGPKRVVFLHGMCGHAQGYAQSFQYAAARWGRLVAPQGDVPCGDGPGAKWSADLERLDARIRDSFAQLGLDAEEIAVIGYSQGATRAEQLVRRYPSRYRYLIEIAAPSAPNPRGLEQLESAVMMAGELDRHDLMLQGRDKLQSRGVPTTFIELPGARHGSMGRDSELTMGRALAWLFSPAARTSSTL